jgi:hypothetical protein
MDVDIYFKAPTPLPITANLVNGFFLLEDGVSYFLFEDLGRFILESSSYYGGNDGSDVVYDSLFLLENNDLLLLEDGSSFLIV